MATFAASVVVMKRGTATASPDEVRAGDRGRATTRGARVSAPPPPSSTDLDALRASRRGHAGTPSSCQRVLRPAPRRARALPRGCETARRLPGGGGQQRREDAAPQGRGPSGRRRGRPRAPRGRVALASTRCWYSARTTWRGFWRRLRPAVHAKGTDYTAETVPEVAVGAPPRHSHRRSPATPSRTRRARSSRACARRGAAARAPPHDARRRRCARGDRVLVTRLNYLGDVVLSLPMVDALRAQFPGVEIDYLTRDPAPTCSRATSASRACWRWKPARSPALRDRRAARARRYRAVIDLYSNPRSAWLSWFSGAPIRVGGDRRGRRRLYTHPVEFRARFVASPTCSCSTVIPLGVYGARGRETGRRGRAGEAVAAAITASRSGRDAAPRMRRWPASAPPRGGPARVGMHPGGKWPRQALARREVRELIASLAHDPRRADASPLHRTRRSATRPSVCASARGSRYLGSASDSKPAAVISRLDAMVACDGGIMHVAVAVGTPTVGIFGSSESSVWFPYEGVGPYRAAHIDVQCRPCHRHECPLGHTRCLNDLSAAAVAIACATLRNSRGSRDEWADRMDGGDSVAPAR